jgi:hypothetical protein
MLTDYRPTGLDCVLIICGGGHERLEKLDGQLEHIATAVVKGFERTDKKIETSESNLNTQIDIYARAVDAYAKTIRNIHARNVSIGLKSG